MNCVILQPSYIPWRGFFHQIHKADIFVFYDDVQYDTRGWRHRNRIKTPQGVNWISIPVHSKGAQSIHIPINQIRICWDQEWNRKHLMTLAHCYKRAPFYSKYEPLLQEFYERKDEFLADFTIASTVAIARVMGIDQTKFMRSSELGVEGGQTQRLVNIARAVGADHYISGPSAESYIEPQLFHDAGIQVEYMKYEYPEYSQLYPPYDSQVSILDLLFMMGEDAGKYIW
jgi:hypothetical protein